MNKADYSNEYKRRLYIFLAVVLLALVFWSSQTLQNTLVESADSLSGFVSTHMALSVALFVLLSALSAMISPLSSAPLVPIVVNLFGENETAFLLLMGWLIGGIASYYIGSHAGISFLNKLIPVKKIEYHKKHISPKTQFAMVVLFRLALPSEIAGYTLGVLRYDPKKYILATIISEIPFAFISVYLAEALLARAVLPFVEVAALATAIVVIALYLFKKKIRK